MKPDLDRAGYAKGLPRAELGAELKRRGLSRRDLAEGPGALGVRETDRSTADETGRGGSAAVFMLQRPRAMGVEALRLDEPE